MTQALQSWVQCDRCDDWVTADAAGLTLEKATELAEYFCERCSSVAPLGKKWDSDRGDWVCEDELEQFLLDAEEKKKRSQEKASQLSDEMLIRMATGIFLSDKDGYSQEAADYCDAVQRVRERQRQGISVPTEILRILDERPLPCPYLNC